MRAGLMISAFMLPASLHFVKTRTTALPQRVRRNRLAALGVLLVHALLLALSWNGQPAPAPLTAPHHVIEVSALAPTRTAAAAERAPDHPAPPTASRPPAPPAASRPATLPAPSPGLDATPAAVAAQTAQPPAGAASVPLADPVGSTQKTGPAQATNPAPRIEPPASSADYLDNPRPAYPALSRRLGEQGQVLLRVWVEADGRPGKMELRRSSGFERLDRAAQQAVQRWRFVPGRRAGTPEAMWAEVPLQFVLE